jgi:cytoskeletal protein RodZ
MNQQHPQQQPGWGQPQQQYPQQPPYPQQPGWGAPPPPPKKTPVGMIVGFSCLGFVMLLVVIGAIGAIAGGDSSSTSKGTSVSADTDANKDTQKKDDAPAAEEEPAEEPAKEEAAPESPVKITAKKTTFAPSVLADGSAYTSVKVTVKNNSDKQISVNVLYFEITDSKGTKHSAELAVDENQIDTVDLAPGENVTVSITGKGKFSPTHVTYTQFLEDPVRVAVS